MADFITSHTHLPDYRSSSLGSGDGIWSLLQEATDNHPNIEKPNRAIKQHLSPCTDISIIDFPYSCLEADQATGTVAALPIGSNKNNQHQWPSINLTATA
nr:hypothetical protein HmN_000337000 [Hymenolepis microstoma]